MKTLINGKFYEITPDTEVVYLNAEVIRITDDGYYNWGIYYHEEFIPLDTFEVDGLRWYFTNDFQEIEIRTFVAELLPARGLKLSDLEWIKTLAYDDGLYNDQYWVYYKLAGQQSFHTATLSATSEQGLIQKLRPDLNAGLMKAEP
ncbi:MAG: hypothetical protein V4594_04630 [Bacteroidota bacterium]